MTREELVDELRDALSDACDMDVTFGQYAEAAVRCLEKNGVLNDDARMIWLEQQAMKSRTGISFDYVPSVDGEPSGFRFMRHHWIGPAHKSIRAAIDDAMRRDYL